MMRQIKSVLWLRSQQLLTNAQYLVLILLPYLFVYIFKMIFPESPESSNYLLSMILMMTFGVSVSPIVSSIISEEKEKNNLRSLKLSGIEGKEYILATLIYPVILSVIAIVVIPLLIGGVNLEVGKGTYFIVSILTGLTIILMNLLIGLLCNTQNQSQVYAMPIMLLSMMVTLLAKMNETFDKINRYLFTGAFSKLFQSDLSDLWTWPEFYSLIIWLVVILVLNVLAFQTLFNGHKLFKLKGLAS